MKALFVTLSIVFLLGIGSCSLNHKASNSLPVLQTFKNLEEDTYGLAIVDSIRAKDECEVLNITWFFAPYCNLVLANMDTSFLISQIFPGYDEGSVHVFPEEIAIIGFKRYLEGARFDIGKVS